MNIERRDLQSEDYYLTDKGHLLYSSDGEMLKDLYTGKIIGEAPNGTGTVPVDQCVLISRGGRERLGSNNLSPIDWAGAIPDFLVPPFNLAEGSVFRHRSGHYVQLSRKRLWDGGMEFPNPAKVTGDPFGWNLVSLGLPKK